MAVTSPKRICEPQEFDISDKYHEKSTQCGFWEPLTEVQHVMADASCSADERLIKAELERMRPEASIKEEWQAKIDAHQERYPGGRLPKTSERIAVLF